MKHAFITSQVAAFTVSVMCRALEVSVSGDYAWRARAKRGPSAHERADVALSARIRAAFVAGRGVYGSPRIHAALRAQGIQCARKRVARLMHTQGLHAGRVRRRKPRTTDSRHAQPVAPDLLARDFSASAPNRKWVLATRRERDGRPAAEGDGAPPTLPGMGPEA